MAVEDDAIVALGDAQRRSPIVVRGAAALPAVRAATNALQLGDELLAR